MLNLLFIVAVIYIAAALYSYGRPILANQRKLTLPDVVPGLNPAPMLYVVAPCRNAAGSVTGFVNSMRSQEYPSERYHIVLLVDADSSEDSTGRIARSLGVEVIERISPRVKTKGSALNNYLSQTLKYRNFEGLVLFDIDARVTKNCLQHVARRFTQGAQVLQGTTLSKNPTESSIARIGDAVQSMVRQRQEGRHRLGLTTLLMGSHGIALHRRALERLGWTLCAEHRLGDDVELNLRAYLADIPMTLAPELQVGNDLAAAVRPVQLQRRRWAAACLELIREYAPRFIHRTLKGDWHAPEFFFALLLMPPFSILFLILTGSVGGSFLILGRSFIHSYKACVLFSLWICQALYYFVVLTRGDHALRWKDAQAFPAFFGMRCLALLQGVWLALAKGSRHRWPTVHSDEPMPLHPSNGRTSS